MFPVFSVIVEHHIDGRNSSARTTVRSQSLYFKANLNTVHLYSVKVAGVDLTLVHIFPQPRLFQNILTGNKYSLCTMSVRKLRLSGPTLF